MIAGTLKQAQRAAFAGNDAVRQAFEYLASADLTKFEPGTVQIDGERIYALCMEIEAKPIGEQPAEKHERFADIHYLVQGEETIGWSTGKEGLQPDKPYDTEKDFCLYGEVPGETMIRLTPGMFAVFFPEDIHRPGLCGTSPGTIRKIVVKIDQELL